MGEQIEEGVLEVGARLPSETNLAGQWGVSRPTIREALRKLEQARLIERVSPKVLVVRDRTADPEFAELRHALRREPLTFNHLHEALLVIEPELTRLATTRVTDRHLERLRSNLAAQQAHLEDYRTWCDLDEAFHLTIAEMSANPALIVMRRPLTELLMPVLHWFITNSRLTSYALRYHERILHEIDARDPETAASLVRRHVMDFGRAWEAAGLDLDLSLADLEPGSGAA